MKRCGFWAVSYTHLFQNWGGQAAPASVRSQDFFMTVLVTEMELAEEFHGIPVNVLLPVKGHTAFIPTRGQRSSQSVFTILQQGGYIKGLVLQHHVIAMEAGQQVFVSGLLSIDPITSFLTNS